MKKREHDPRRLDIERFATEGGQLSGDWPLAAMTRLVALCDPAQPAADAQAVRWSALGERRRRPGAGSDAWLRLELDAQVRLTCQRCLAPVETPLAVDRWFHFVEGEQQAAELDADSEDDVLASTRAFDLQTLAEDELLLALPLVPRHAVCPQPLLPEGAAAAEEASLAEPESAHPFSVLAALKRGPH
ncbi:MAG: DUF177 domain-containing protein [Rhizobacter sp.]|nr:DUF177 domain-containing protein [Rhizobacter sp.]